MKWTFQAPSRRDVISEPMHAMARKQLADNYRQLRRKDKAAARRVFKFMKDATRRIIEQATIDIMVKGMEIKTIGAAMDKMISQARKRSP